MLGAQRAENYPCSWLHTHSEALAQSIRECRDQSRPLCQQTQSPQCIFSTSLHNHQAIEPGRSNIPVRFSHTSIMVRNHPEDPFQRRNIVDRTSSSYAIKAQLIGVVHGHISETEKPATLLVLSFRFQPHRRNVRIKSANISVEFYGDVGCPTVSAMAPDGRMDVVS